MFSRLRSKHCWASNRFRFFTRAASRLPIDSIAQPPHAKPHSDSLVTDIDPQTTYAMIERDSGSRYAATLGVRSSLLSIGNRSAAIN